MLILHMVSNACHFGVKTRDISRISKGHGAFKLKGHLLAKKEHLARPLQCFRDMSKGQGDPSGIFGTKLVFGH
jgi:hypothetical protein